MNFKLTEGDTVLMTGGARDIVSVLKYMHVQGGHSVNAMTVTDDTGASQNVDEFLIQHDTKSR